MKQSTIYFLAFIISIGKIHAQDPYFSQPYASAQFLNTAAVGNGVYEQRINGNVRTQFIDNNKSYQTIFAGWDWRAKMKFANDANYMGYGLNVLSDQIMGGAINSNHVTFNMAYHMFLDADYSNNISLGLGATYTNTSVDRTRLIFADQYDPYANLTNNPTAELFRNNASRFSMNAGVLYTRHTNKTFFQAGGSLYYQAVPDLIYTTYNTKLGFKSNLYVNYETLFENNYTASFHASYINRNNNNQILTGGAVGLPMSTNNAEDKKLYVGCYYRLGDAVIPSVKILMNKQTLGFTYDIYNSSITQARLRQNTFELSFSTSIGNKRGGLLRTIYD
jgi:hypothetical protein